VRAHFVWAVRFGGADHASLYAPGPGAGGDERQERDCSTSTYATRLSRLMTTGPPRINGQGQATNE
jgi:hypothetical protein